MTSAERHLLIFFPLMFKTIFVDKFMMSLVRNTRLNRAVTLCPPGYSSDKKPEVVLVFNSSY